MLFDWDDCNRDHVGRHGLTADEVEEALLDPERIGVDANDAGDERRTVYIGATEEGRALLVVTTRRRRRLRVVTARDTTERERRRYRRQRTHR